MYAAHALASPIVQFVGFECAPPCKDDSVQTFNLKFEFKSDLKNWAETHTYFYLNQNGLK
jgi:hypothetical protein